MNDLINWIIKNQKFNLESINEDSLSTLPLKIISEISVYIDFIQKAILPSINELKQDYLETLDSDIYKKYLINRQSIDKQTTEFINLFYVGLYHKLENFENDMVAYVNSETNSNYKDVSDLEINFDSDFFDFRNKFRLIANSIKHNDGLPKNGLSKYINQLDLNKKIELNNETLLKDTYELENYLSRIFSFMYLSTALKHLENLLPKIQSEQKDKMEKSIVEIKDLMTDLKENNKA
jgi:hypothetical protein